ncbi:hypothetical protein FBEOM_11266 [Fusarium beomiforme]|uniref:Uncharacterized protein n=1 Tax=Fusarium beomiforme TaxID=44412 RepID=A0A9P5AAD4_9HYPO|nr:hypothetical protein FBEOM_11266 [Fusarium beomiforme]
MTRTTTRRSEHTQWKCTKFLVPIDHCNTTMPISTKKCLICGNEREARYAEALDASGVKLGMLIMVDSSGEETWDYI